MRTNVLDKPVGENVALFLTLLKKIPHQSAPHEKAFSVWINRHSGQLSCAQSSQKAAAFKAKEWKPIIFSYRYDPKQGEIYFLVQEKGRKEVFQTSDLTLAAFSALKETMHVFAEVSHRLKGPSDLNTKISVLLKLAIDVTTAADRNMLIVAWHPGDRLQAEFLLKKKPAGTFLFRKDPFAELLEGQLEELLGKKIKCFTLTCLQGEDQYCDYTLVHSDGAWQIYDDDPSLGQTTFATLKQLLNSLKGIVKYPLYTNPGK